MTFVWYCTVIWEAPLLVLATHGSGKMTICKKANIKTKAVCGGEGLEQLAAKKLHEKL